MFPSTMTREIEVDEASTIESLMRDKLFCNDKIFKGHVEHQFYWLCTSEEDFDHFPVPQSKEKQILKLIYKEEKKFEASFDQIAIQNIR